MSEYGAALVYAAMIVIMFCQVILRYVFNAPLMWPEEASRLLFIWTVYLGAHLALAQKSHLEVDYFVGRLPLAMRFAVQRVLSIFVAGWLCLVLYEGIKITGMYMSSSAYTLPWLPLGLFYLPIPLGAALMLVQVVRNLLGRL